MARGAWQGGRGCCGGSRGFAGVAEVPAGTGKTASLLGAFPISGSTERHYIDRKVRSTVLWLLLFDLLRPKIVPCLCSIKEQLLENVRIKLLDIVKMQPGRERRYLLQLSTVVVLVADTSSSRTLLGFLTSLFIFCSAAIRDLRARYHPDRHVHLPMLAAVFKELTALINTRTDPLLAEDRRHHT